MSRTRFELWERRLLEEQPIARLATIAPSGRPRLVPVCFALLEDALAIAVDEKPKSTVRLARLTDLARDPRATLLVDRYDTDWSRLAWVRVEARAEVLAAGAAWPAALAALRDRYDQYRVMDLEGRPLIRLRPERIVSWRAVTP